MTDDKKLRTVKLNYETKSGTNWEAYVLTFSGKEAIDFTKRIIGKNFHTVREVSETSRVDAITDEVQDFLKRNESTEEKESLLICPWCDKSFDTKHGLKVHLSKSCKKESSSEKE